MLILPLMKTFRFFLLCCFLAGYFFAEAQVLQVQPENPTTDNYITVIYDASLGNAALADYDGDIYAYTGVITAESNSDSDWKHVQSDWGSINPDLLMNTYGENKYAISFNIRDFYGIAPEEEVIKLAFLFNNEDYSLIGRSAEGSDMLIEVNMQTAGNYLSHTLNKQSLGINTENGYLEISFFKDRLVKTEFSPEGYTSLDTSFTVTGEKAETSVYLNESESKLLFSSDSLEVHINKYPVKLSYIKDADTIFADRSGIYANAVGGGSNFKIKESEAFYGTGSRAVPINRRGMKLRIYNEAHWGYGNGTPTLNLSLPLVFSSDEYAFFADNRYPMVFDLGESHRHSFKWSCEGGKLRYYFFAGSYSEILNNYTELTGNQDLPPLWALGYIQSKYGYENETHARNVVDELIAQDFPLDALILDLYWFGETGDMGNLDWDYTDWPQPAQMMTDFENMGIKTILITEPYFTMQSDNYEFLDNNGYFAFDQTGETFPLYGFWAGDAALIDFSNTQTHDWMWQFYRERFTEGADAWWCDLGEPETHPSEMLHQLGSAKSVHNIYSLIWAKFIYENHYTDFPSKRLFNLIRSGYAGMQRYATFPWSGDIERSFNGLQAQIPVMLGTSICGIPYMHSDVGGFTGNDNNGELFARWVQFGTFAPVLRVHGHGTHIEPTAYNEPYKSIAREYIKLRYRMLPYNYTLAWKNTTTGMPLSLQMNFFNPENESLNNINDQYFWGENLLVAPITEAGQTERNLIFPEGIWIDFFENTRYSEAVYSVQAEQDKIPVFAKAGSFIPMTRQIYNTSDYKSDSLHVLYFPDESIMKSSFTLFADDGSSPSSLQNNEYQTIIFNGTFNTTDIEILINTNGAYPDAPEKRDLIMEIRRIGTFPETATFDDLPLIQVESLSELKNTADTWFFSTNEEILYAHAELTGEQHILNLSGLSGSEIKPEEPISGFAISKVAPNPFQEQVTVSYDIVEEGNYQIMIYELTGKLIKQEPKQDLSAGRHYYNWKCSAETASGVYILKILSDKSSSRQIRLVKF